MGLTKQQKLKNSLIQKEQQQLLKIKKELGSMLVQVNEAINVLKVEELQLKSSAVVFDNQNTVNTKQTKPQRNEISQLDFKPSVSHLATRDTQQNTNLNLEIKVNKEIEEYDDDEDEMC